MGYLRIEVRDRSDRTPSPALPRQDASSGRGLPTVAALATSWGSRREDAGKVVWTDIDPHGISGHGEGRILSDFTH